jgi:hypothetical protein
VGTPEDWQRIECELGFKDFDARRRDRLWRELASIFRLYFDPTQPPDVRPGNYRRALEALERHAVRLFVDLSPSGRLEGSVDGTFAGIISDRPPVCEPDDVPTDGLNELDRWALAYLSLEIRPSAKRRALLAALAELIAAAGKAKNALPEDAGGQARNWRIQGAIYELAELYAELSGKKPGLSRYPPGPRRGQPTGPFFRFVKACFDTFAPARTETVETSEPRSDEKSDMIR